MTAWLKTHWRQIVTLLASFIVGALLHFGKLTVDQGVAIGAALALVGIHLPAVTYSLKPPVVPTAMMVICLLCTLPYLAGVSCAPAAPTPATIAGAECVTHRTALQLACVDMYDAGADIDACRARVKASIDCTKDGGQ